MPASPDSSQPPILGIDLGTTNSLVAVCDEHGPRVLGGLMPSAVRYAVGEGGTPVATAVGDPARVAAPLHPKTTVYSAKRLMGRSAADLAGDAGTLAYDVVEGAHETARIALGPGPDGPVTVSPQEVAAEVLRTLRARAEAELGVECTDAVITVPAYFDDAQRQATRDAGRLAGLNVRRIVNEPTAAALAYGIGSGASVAAETIAVFDLGGGTFDISILRVEPASEGNDTSFFEVLSTAGDTHLGGDDVDAMIIDRALSALREVAGADMAWTPTPEQVQTLRQLAQAVKHKLSDDHAATMDLTADIAGAEARATVTITRDEFDAMITPWLDRAFDACARAIADASLTAGAIDRVVLVGGSTRIPLVRSRVRDFFGAEPYTALDPDRVVALGAAQQAAILSGANTGALLLDVIPLSLGIETIGGATAKLIIRNSTVPARATEMFSTSVDGQTKISLNVLQGEREMAEDCRSLATFILEGIPPMPAGIPQVEVEFLVDANGVLSVTATERRSGTAASIQVVPNHGLTEDEVDRIERDALEHAREDMTRHRVVDLVANSKLDLKWIRERLPSVRDQLTPDEAGTIDAHASAVEAFITDAEADWSSVDPNAFHAAKQALDEASIPMHEKSIAQSLREA